MSFSFIAWIGHSSPCFRLCFLLWLPCWCDRQVADTSGCYSEYLIGWFEIPRIGLHPWVWVVVDVLVVQVKSIRGRNIILGDSVVSVSIFVPVDFHKGSLLWTTTMQMRLRFRFQQSAPIAGSTYYEHPSIHGHSASIHSASICRTKLIRWIGRWIAGVSERSSTLPFLYDKTLLLAEELRCMDSPCFLNFSQVVAAAWPFFFSFRFVCHVGKVGKRTDRTGIRISSCGGIFGIWRVEKNSVDHNTKSKKKKKEQTELKKSHKGRPRPH